MSYIDSIRVPTLLLDEVKCKNNIKSMADRARQFGLIFRPHFKTHQSHVIGSWFRSEGISAIAVSSVRMAQYFAEDGWDDITIAFPFNVREARSINELAGNCKINIVLESPSTIDLAGKVLHEQVGVFIKLDVGAGRTGIHTDNIGLVEFCIDMIGSYSKLQLRGFLAHAGHTYSARSKQEIVKVHNDARSKLHRIHELYCGNTDLIISYGDTPSCSVASDWEGIDEIRPGNFVFYDLMQTQIGSCDLTQMAVSVACPVVAVHKDRQEAVMYGGAIHFGKDRLISEDGKVSFGRVRLHDEDIGSLVRLSQEHGVIDIDSRFTNILSPGDIVYIDPVHSCMTAQYIGGYRTHEGKSIDHLAHSRLTP